MTREKQLIKNTGILAIGKICTQFVSFFLLPLYTAYLTTKEYGIVDLLNNYISLLIPIFFFQMDQAVFRFLIDTRKDEKKQSEIVTTAILTVVIQSLFFIILYLIASLFINNEYKYFLLTNVIAAMASGISLQICRGLGDNVNYSIGSLISGITTIILNVIFIAIFKFGAYGMLTATLIANMVCIIYIFIRKKIYKMINIKNNSTILRKQLWKYSIPLIPNQLSWWIVNVSDRTIITQAINVGANGIYSAANKFSAICVTFFNFFNMTWSESASLHIKDGDIDDFFSKIMNTSIKLFSSICLIIISCMPFCFKLLITGKEYASAYYQIPILMFATIFNIIVALFGSIYVALKKTKEISKTSIFAAIINITINVLLIKKIGLFAASTSTLIAYLTMAIYRYIDVQKYVKIKIEKKAILYILFMAIITIISYYMQNKVLCVAELLVLIICALFLNKKITQSLISIIKNKTSSI
ncbi:MAG: lipopolysaccharide biosynthesis protein [Bacilli bacterium]